MTVHRAIGRFQPDPFVLHQFARQDEAHTRFRNVLDPAGNKLILFSEPYHFHIQIGQCAVV